MLGRLAVLWIACSDPDAGPGKLSGRFELPLYRAPRASSPIEVDGRLDEAAWRDAPQAILVRSRDGGALEPPTTARLVWDEERLYAGFTCEDREARPTRGPRGEGPARAEDEVVEVLLDPVGAERDYVEIEVSAANVRVEARFRVGRRGLPQVLRWNSGARTAVAIERRRPGERSWTVEVALPLETLRGEARMPRSGHRWRMNLYRLSKGDGAEAREGGAFSPPLGPDLQAVDRFGWLFFD